MNINLKNMIIIFIIFVFISVLFSVLLKKIDKIEKNERIVYKDRPNHFFYDDIPNYIFHDDIPNYIFHDATPYIFPRRSIDINVINKPDTSNDEIIARELQKEYDKNSPRSFSSRRSSRSPSPRASSPGILKKRGERSRSYSPAKRVDVGREGETRIKVRKYKPRKDDWKPGFKNRSATIKDGKIQAIEPFSNLESSCSLYPFN